MVQSDLIPLDEMMTRLERVLAGSPADSTELAWIEARRSEAWSGRGQRAGPPDSSRRDRTLLIRVRQSGRTGLHRTGSFEPSELENAVRDALAQARLAPPTPPEALAGAGEPAAAPQRAAAAASDLFDPEIAATEPAQARQLLDRMAARGEQLHLAWLEGSVAVANSAGARRAVRVTAASFTAGCGHGAGAGRVSAAARRLALLEPEGRLELARSRRTPDGGPAAAPAAAELPAGAALVLSEQSAAALVELLNRHALAAAAMRDGGSWLCGQLGEAVFAPCLSLRDDGAEPLGLPFPFDLAGWAKRPVDLVAAGVFVTPAVDAGLAQQIGRPPTPHAAAPGESIAANLQLLAADGAPLAEPELLRQAEAGLWIGALERVECFDPRRLRFRALARGVRRIAAGELGAALPDLLWEGTLPEALGRAQALGGRPLAIATADMLFGATTAPLLLLRGDGGWSFTPRGGDN